VDIDAIEIGIGIRFEGADNEERPKRFFRPVIRLEKESSMIAAEPRTASEAAFAELYERHADRIYGFCRRRLRSRQEAEDAVQETFVAALRAIQRGSVPVCESAWLFKIAENVCFAVYRSGARRDVRDLSDSDRMARLAARDGSADSLFGLDQALNALPASQRRAFVLRELRGLSYKEIAIELGVSVASVETLIYRARRGLARSLDSGAGLRGRLTASANLGSTVVVVKGWLAGATAVKVVSAAAVVAVATASAGDTLQQSRGPARPVSVATVELASVRKSVPSDAQRAADEVAVPPVRSHATRVNPRPLRERPRPVPTGARPIRPSEQTAPTQASDPVAPVSPPASEPPAPPPPPALPRPSQPQPAAPVAAPAVPAPVVQVPTLPALPQVPIDVPDAVGLLPAASPS
jgi:RNA polymerase sigma-70 factor (ECF subfamily)